MKPLPLLGSWKPVAGVVVIVAAAVALETYSTKQNIPADATQPQSEQAQQPVGANMAALQQIQDMEQQVKANPANLDVVLHLANVLNDNRFYDKAITYYKMYLDKRPKDTNARVDMGICYKEIGSYDDAVREMKKALEHEPKHLFATYNLGIVALDEGKMYMDRGQMDKANELIRQSNDWFRKTVALAPTSEVGKRAQQLLTQHSNAQFPQSN
jgi:tetratricopeptide (TPR) repeat protein